MAASSTFFLCDREELLDVCAGWKLPLDQPRQLPAGDGTMVDSWVPLGRHGNATLTANLDHVPTLDLFNIDDGMLEQLCRAILGDASLLIAHPAAFPPPDSEQSVYEVPGEAVTRLAALGEAEVELVAQAWVELMRADLAEITSRFTREARLSGCTLEAWLPAVQQLAAFAREATEDAIEMYLCLSP